MVLPQACRACRIERKMGDGTCPGKLGQIAERVQPERYAEYVADKSTAAWRRQPPPAAQERRQAAIPVQVIWERLTRCQPGADRFCRADDSRRDAITRAQLQFASPSGPGGPGRASPMLGDPDERNLVLMDIGPGLAGLEPISRSISSYLPRDLSSPGIAPPPSEPSEQVWGVRSVSSRVSSPLPRELRLGSAPRPWRPRSCQISPRGLIKSIAPRPPRPRHRRGRACAGSPGTSCQARQGA